MIKALDARMLALFLEVAHSETQVYLNNPEKRQVDMIETAETILRTPLVGLHMAFG